MKALVKKSSAMVGDTAANQQTSMTLNSGTAETRTYDDWGRLTARAQGTYSAAYSYRYGDRLRQVTSSFPGETATSPVYEYGGDGKMRRRGTEEIKYGLGFNPVAERTNLLMAKYFVYEPHKAVSERLAYFGGGFDASQHYYNHDHLGSVRRTRSSSKGSLAVWDYEPFGKVHSGTATPLIFALHPYESGMRMHRAPYRNYSPNMARWTTVDPLGMVDGPNVYGYVGGNPTNYIDGSGTSLISTLLFLAGSSGIVLTYGCAKCAADAIDLAKKASEGLSCDCEKLQNWMAAAAPGSECRSVCISAGEWIIKQVANLGVSGMSNCKLPPSDSPKVPVVFPHPRAPFYPLPWIRRWIG